MSEKDRKEIEIVGKKYRYRYRFTLSEAGSIIDASYKFDEITGMPYPSAEKLRIETIHAAIPEMSKKAIADLPETVGLTLYNAIMDGRRTPL